MEELKVKRKPSLSELSSLLKETRKVARKLGITKKDLKETIIKVRAEARKEKKKTKLKDPL